ncbi:hypothetical protein FA15DRAFT_666530 [Coprinopsis marcescibilis]|uniref:OTU domain-containing protein n=1 Tax=Coprinopsis marcescibilis TaxID=230819 RepID=A0A5C3L335_COPMA|nr:hypothetical protein FA15DRAFT_666530 [Coprinopsis marcescibilis]
MGKTHRKNQPQGRTRTTRSSNPRLVLSDPNESSAQLTSQLRALGLYAANILGDGNCLFRALSDQLFGSPSKHAQLRQDICDFIVKHKSRYEPFVEDERGLDVHIRCMRENGTYGGHLELSAFAHTVRRNVKVVQPGLVYVIEWDAGLDEEEREKAMRQLEAEQDDQTICHGTVYVAYHDWEHFSSIRNLKGPHSGLPNVTERPGVDVQPVPLSSKDREKEGKREREKERKEKEKARKITRVKLKLSAPSPVVEQGPSASTSQLPLTAQDPTRVPLPDSRSPSSSSTPAPEPFPSFSTSSGLSVSPPSSAAQSQLAPSELPITASSLPHSMRVHRSPKRSFDESTSSEDGASNTGDVADEIRRIRGRDKRSRIGSVVVDEKDQEHEREETPGLSAPGSSSSSSSSSASENSSVDGDDEDIVDEDEVPKRTCEPGTASNAAHLPPGLGEEDDGYSSLSELESVASSRAATPLSAPPAPLSSRSKSPHVIRKQQKSLSHMPVRQKPHSHSVSANSYANSHPTHTQSPHEKPLTRRQRKALGLPKPRAALVFGADNNSPGAGRDTGAGKIIIPGGRFKGRGAVKVREFRDGEGDGDEVEKDGQEVEEWVKSGVGRVDVRGFRELKI